MCPEPARLAPRGSTRSSQTLAHVRQSLDWRESFECGLLRLMKPKTEEFLNFLLWNAERLARPTFHNLNESYEGWAYRNGLLKQVAVLEKHRLIERDASQADPRVCRLTAQGRLHALGGRDPEAWWSRAWDNRWRLVAFDVPRARNAHRNRLRRYLRDRGFGCLQGSLWITPDALDAEKQILTGAKINVESLILLEAQPCGGESDADIVAGAWDFDRINRRYARHLKTLEQRPTGKLGNEAAARAMQRWARAERETWLEAVTYDPLLPERILPRDYLGRQAWQGRIEALRDGRQQLDSFKPRF